MSESEEDFERTMIIPPPGGRAATDTAPRFGSADGGDRMGDTVIMRPASRPPAAEPAKAAAPKVDFDVTHDGHAPKTGAALPASPMSAPAKSGGHGLFLVVALVVAAVLGFLLLT